jgi:pimeloyl-ACP methyl ester carboxylesterase
MNSHFAQCLLLLGLPLAAVAAEPGLTRVQAEAELQKQWSARLAQLQSERTEEMTNRVIELKGRSMRWEERVFGAAPTNGRSLWISMHGGGGAPKQVNDSQWRNQIGLYKPDEGIYVAPRAPTDTWNLWHEAHIDPMFDRLIENFVALRGVDPDRVYILGYSAGGDGVWQLAPRMADRWAAAAMMAGHPNDASLLPLRNLPFALFVGGNDSAYGRNKVVAERAEKLAELHKQDPGGYEHLARVYPGLPHWMNRKDAEALPWMAKFTRNPWPKKVVWVQDDVTHTRFYWLAVPPEEAKRKRQIIGEVDGQNVKLSGEVPQGITVRLSDALLNLNQPVRVRVTNREIFHAIVPRTTEAIRKSFGERADPRSAATAEITLRWE